MTALKRSTIPIALGERSYNVYVGTGILEHLGACATEAGLGGRALVITNDTVGDVYGPIILKSLQRAGITPHYATFPDGESYKSTETAARLYDACVDAQLDRGSFVVALGGGVVGDVAGFVAGTYMRGVDYVQVPTTLLAQVDSSVGGKTAVNHPKAKNLIGLFHQPRLVWADVGTLVSLPERQFKSGLAEVVKAGLIADAGFFDFLEREWFSLLRRTRETLVRAVVRSVEIKGEVVSSDERETGLRAILNYGHTVGHAIEAVTRYERFTHGEAISIGMAVEGRLSVQLGRLSEPQLQRSLTLLEKLGLPVTVPSDLPADEVVLAMSKDKKVKDGRMRLALVQGIGAAGVVDDVPAERIHTAWNESR